MPLVSYLITSLGFLCLKDTTYWELLMRTEHLIITLEYLNKHKTKKGGYNKKQVEALGLSWPLTSGWKNKLVGNELSIEQSKEFERYSEEKPNNVHVNKIRKMIEYLFTNKGKLSDRNIADLKRILE